MALLLCLDLSPKTHNGTISRFNNHFIKKNIFHIEYGKFFAYLFDARQECDYKDFVEYNREDVEPLIEKTKDFLEVIEKYITEKNMNV